MFLSNRPRWTERLQRLESRVGGGSLETIIGRGVLVIVGMEVIRFAVDVLASMASLGRLLLGWLTAALAWVV